MPRTIASIWGEKNVPGTSAEIERKLGLSMNDNGYQK